MPGDIGPHAASPRHVGDDSAEIQIHIPPLGKDVTVGESCAPPKSPSLFLKQGQYQNLSQHYSEESVNPRVARAFSIMSVQEREPHAV